MNLKQLKKITTDPKSKWEGHHWINSWLSKDQTAIFTQVQLADYGA